MNLVNLFGNKTKEPEPEYFLAVEVQESLIKTALWEVLDGEPSIVNIGTFESWADEESLINGVDASLEQAIKIISAQPRRVILGLPDSWMDKNGIHPTKDKLIKRLIKELNLEPIGMVPLNSAIAHFLKKHEGIPPTAILLEVYSSKVAVSYIDRGEVRYTEEVSKSGDLAKDVEEALTGMDVPNFPARFILTNGSNLEDEQQQITAYQWQDRLPFTHFPKVEVLPIDFSIRAVALAGGAEAVRFIGINLNEPSVEITPLGSVEKPNIVIPEVAPPEMSEFGFSYEETSAPESVSKAETGMVSDLSGESDEVVDLPPVSHEYALPATPPAPRAAKPAPSLKLPTLPKLTLPSFPKNNARLVIFAAIPIIILAVSAAVYFFMGSAEIAIRFKPQTLTQTFAIAISEENRSDMPTLIAVKKTVSGSSNDSIATSGETTVGEKSTGAITIYNRSIAPLVLKAGTVVGSENGKYNYTISTSVTVASKSADLLSGSEVFGKAEGVKVTANKIGADYNLSKANTFSVDNYSKTVAYAVSESDFSGGTSRAVKAVSKTDQDKLLAQATDKIKAKTQAELQTQSPGTRILPLTDLQFTKKSFDHSVGEEATTIGINLEGSLDILVYSEDSLYSLASDQLKKILPVGMSVSKEKTQVSLESPTKTSTYFLAKASTKSVLQPIIDETKLTEYIKGKNVSDVRHFFEYISGFDGINVRISPPIPVLSKYIPLRNITFILSPL